MSSAASFNWKRTTIALVAFGMSFGYLEAAVVTYLRALSEPVRQHVYPELPPGELFPLVGLDHLKAAGQEQLRLLKAELAREVATLVMLAAVAVGLAKSRGQWLAAFLIAFGTWDLFFYAFLKVLLNWPDSLLTWDLLFLIPVPWTGPVLAPVLVSLSMIGAGFVTLAQERAGRPVRLRPLHWLGIVAGGLIVVISFTQDFRRIAAGGMPDSFNWLLFALGEATGLGSFVHAIRATRRGD